MVLCMCYGISGADRGYAATRSGVLSESMTLRELHTASLPVVLTSGMAVRDQSYWRRACGTGSVVLIACMAVQSAVLRSGMA
eukprot:858236-Rhodomonas_salina.2